ncbi:MAG: VapB-type antitoxin [Candidatus Bathyarchaeia archaeon]|nr:VapB-type antitoxin [Candidatus Bathyarchaeota archaeon]
MSAIVSVRIKKEIKEELEKAGINISKEIKKTLEDLAWQVKIKKQIEKWNAILAKIKPSEEGFSVRSVREDRESH